MPIPTLRRLCLAAALFAAMAVDAAAQGAPPAPPVVVSKPVARRVAQWDEYTGRFEATDMVEVRARVSGFIDKIHFTDGAMVRKGDLLFTIDQRPYRIALDAAKADVERAMAQVSLAEADVERADSLERTRVLTQRDIDQRRANLSVARATQLAAEAAVQNAQLNLEWTEVRAPIAGRISDKKVDLGNLIAGGQSGATLLTTIVNLDPIHFVFDASEADYLRYSRLASHGSRPSSRDAGNPVQVRLADETDWKREGRMNFVDNQLNPRSGTIRGRAVFENKDLFLTPGTFGRLRLYGGENDALLVPDASIVSDQAHKIVLVVGADSKVGAKPVQLGAIVDGLRVVRAGLDPNDRVVIGGLANPFVRPGVAVSAQDGEIKAASNK